MEDLNRVKSELEGLSQLYNSCLTKLSGPSKTNDNDEQKIKIGIEQQTLKTDLNALTNSILAQISEARETLNSKMEYLFNKQSTPKTAITDLSSKTKHIEGFKVIGGEQKKSPQSPFILINDNIQVWGKRSSSSLEDNKQDPKVDWPTLQSIYGASTNKNQKNLETIIFQFERIDSENEQEDEEQFLKIDYNELEISLEEIEDEFSEVGKMVNEFLPQLSKKQVLLCPLVKEFFERNKDSGNLGRGVQDKYGRIKALVNILKHFSQVMQ